MFTRKVKLKMSKKTWLWLIMLIMILAGFVYIIKSTEPSIEDKQKVYLREHESELTKFILEESPDVVKVNYDWEHVKVKTIGNGLTTGAGKVIQLFGEVSSETKSSFRLDIDLDKKEMPDLSTIRYGHAPKIE